jgi:uncharacterized protein (DUF362 family)
MNKVSVVSVDDDVYSAVRKSVKLVGDLSPRPGHDVVVKPNICNSKNPGGMVITDFRIISSVIELVRERGNDVVVVESDNINGSADERARKSGLLGLLDELDAPFLNLSNDDYEEFRVAETTLKIPRTVLDADYFINLPKMKTCAHTLVTLSIKNLYGLFQRANKSQLHRKLDEILPFLAEKIRCDLVVMDGINCMEGNGPVVGNKICMNLVLASNNIVAMDSVCSMLMGYDPSEIPHIALSAQRGLGEKVTEKIEVLGENWVQHIHEFERPYTLKATLKSVKAIKDIYLNRE